MHSNQARRCADITLTNGGENSILCQQTPEVKLLGPSAQGLATTLAGSEILVVVGPTAVGKTAVAIEVARQIGGEIISADSMQVYRYMDIGTAKPSAIERDRTRFHLIDIAFPDQQMTVSEWKRLAEASILEIQSRGKVAIVCGGTGLYVRALLDDWQLAETPGDPALRSQLRARCEKAGPQLLHRELAELDPASAARLHPNDAVRIVRALEVFYATGIAISDFQRNDRERANRRPARRIGLTLPRPELYERINFRVDQMIGAGLEAEVRWLLSHGFPAETGSMKSLGYKEMAQHASGQMGYSETVSAIKQNTRRYAKRQQTWFRGDSAIQWIDVSAHNSATVAGLILSRLEKEHGNH